MSATLGSPGPDDEVWWVVRRSDGRTLAQAWSITDARESITESGMLDGGAKPTDFIVARWDAEGLRWIEAPAPTIMVELPVDYVRWWAGFKSEAITLPPACRAALEREGLT